jgi:hypothetical protein
MLNNYKNMDSELLLYAAYDDLLTQGMRQAEALDLIAQKFPDYAEKLREYAITSTISAGLSSNQFLEDLEEKIVQKSYSILKEKFQISSEKLENIINFESLLKYARDLKIDLASFSMKLGLGRSVLVKLDRHLLDPLSIPNSLILKLSEILEISQISVEQYFLKPPTLSRAASFRSDAPPSLNASKTKESFQKALETSVNTGEISKEQFEAWKDQK